LHEANVPFVISEPLIPSFAERQKKATLRSHEIFEYALNGVA